MKSCFSVVDASPYHHMCMVPNRNSGMEAGCQAAVAYVQACAAKSIRVRVPPNCVKYSHPHPIHVDTFNFFFNGCVIIRWMDFFFPSINAAMFDWSSVYICFDRHRPS